ncbi:MAG: phage portal protein [Micropruina sp.]|nr:phage portal protein [Micropruina sp.]
MGWFNRTFNIVDASRAAVAPVAVVQPNPFSTSTLSKVILSELYGVKAVDVSRGVAMKVPAVARGRALICGTLSRHPLTLWKYNADGVDTKLETPKWMTSTKTKQSPIERMLWTLDDLIFYGTSLWATERDDNNQIIDALRVDRSNWSVDPDTLGVLINGQLAKDDQVIIFEGPQEGLLSIAPEAIKASRDMANAWQERVKSPIPMISFKQTDENIQLTDDEIDDLIIDAELARQNGGTAFEPVGFEMRVLGDVKTDLYVEGRNAERLDWGNYLSIPAAMLDGSMSTATLTYSTAEGKRSEFVDYSLNYWASSVEARLSQDDVSPEDTYSRFDISWLTNGSQPANNPRSED